jgi:PAS domain S-box-containing protein
MISWNEPTDPAFSVMTLDILSNVLHRADKPSELGIYLTEEIRELTGASCVLLIQYSDPVVDRKYRVVSVNPSRRCDWAESSTAISLYDITCQLQKAHVWHARDPSDTVEILRQEGFELSLAVPLRVGSFTMGAMLVLGLPDEEHLESEIDLLNTLSTIIALVLRNAFLYEKQEQVIEERTADLQRTNEQLRIELSERKRVEETLKESEERFRTLSEASFESIVIHKDGLIVDVNRAALEHTGYSREDVIGRPILDFFAPESVAVVKEVIRLPVVEAYEAHLRKKNGEILTVQIRARTMDFNGQPARVATIMDITEQVNARKRIEELVQKKEEERIRLKTILDTLPVGVLYYDANGALIEVNEIAKEIMRGEFPLVKSIGEYTYQGWWADSGIKLRPEDWAGAKAIISGERIKGQVIDVMRFDGTRGTILDSGAPLKDAKGRILGSVAIIQDITKHRQLEHEAVEAKERAELYIDLLTHDINNMNAATQGYLQLVLEKSGLEEKGRRQIQNSLDLLGNSSHLIDNVKKLQSLESAGQRSELVDLGWLLEDVVEEFKNYPGREVTINYKPQLKRMVMASGLLRDAFENIIGNSIKHNKGPLAIDVQLGKAFEEGREFYRVSIEDNGQGIPDSMKEKIFSRLYRGKTKASGRGLGLYLVKKLVEDSNGRVWVEDRIAGDNSKGARFVVVLPVAFAR